RFPDRRVSPSEPAGLRVCRLSVFSRASSASHSWGWPSAPGSSPRAATVARPAPQVVRTGCFEPEGTTTQPSNERSLYGALSGTLFALPAATAKDPPASSGLAL